MGLFATCIFVVAQQTITVKLTNASDDLEEWIAPKAGQTQSETVGNTDYNSSDLELGCEGNGVGKNPLMVGLRFPGISIPKGATIVSAYMEFEVDATSKNQSPCNLYVFAENNDNPETFNGAANSPKMLTSRPKLNDSVSWTIASDDFTTVNSKYKSADIKTLVQKLVNRNGWANGNAMAFYITGTGTREVESVEGEAAAAASLIITFTEPGVVPGAGLAFSPKIDIKWDSAIYNHTIQVSKPIKSQVLYVGGRDSVAYISKTGAVGKDKSATGNDFLGVTPGSKAGEYYLSINLESKAKSENLGDGGHVTSFKVERDANTDTFKIVEQTLADGRKGKFFNVDFVNTVGETWTNCGGIIAPNGRIWTAEEYPAGNNKSLGFSDTSDVVVGQGVVGENMIQYKHTPSVTPLFNGQVIERYQNVGWMVEIDPRTSKAIRKQFNWGRMSYEGGVIMPDNKTVFNFEDGTPGLLTKFVANTAGDFTSGNLYVYKNDATGPDGRWIKMDNSNLKTMISMADTAYKHNATMFVRLEWGVEIDGKVYIAETGKDDAGKDLLNYGASRGGKAAPHHNIRAIAQGRASAIDSAGGKYYADYYGRILCYDPAKDSVSVFLEGGYSNFVDTFDITDKDVPLAKYPRNHLSNTDGLGKAELNGKKYMLLQEDLNGSTYGRNPQELYSYKPCEMYMLDMTLAPKIMDGTITNAQALDTLIRVMIGAKGAELTGGVGINGNTILVNNQHANSNTVPFKGTGVTVAINGFNGKDFEAFDLKMTGTTSLYEKPQVPSQLTYQVLFVGGMDSVIYSNSTFGYGGKAKSKAGNDFIGFTKDTVTGTPDLGWVTVNQEANAASKEMGGGGGMTSFKVKVQGDSLVVVNQTIFGTTGKLFNVDFKNTVGETWKNCGGIIAPDGRIWTAEEYPPSSLSSVVNLFGDANKVKIGSGILNYEGSGIAAFENQTLKRFENIGWMVEIDPKTSKAIRKQYNWGRMSFEGGVIMPDNKTAFLFEDGTPGMLTKFVADNANDFTKGSLYVYKNDVKDAVNGHWIKMDNNNVKEMVYLADSAWKRGATSFVRLEWGTEIGGKVYIAETGKDDAGKDLLKGKNRGAIVAPHHNARAIAQGRASAIDSAGGKYYADYYGRILVYDPTKDSVSVFLEGGPDKSAVKDVPLAEYPANHLSNPDGLGKFKTNGKDYMLICEDLNGKTYGRQAKDHYVNLCELYMLDMSITNPKVDDLVRIMVSPKGAELTGAVGTPDGKSILVNVQHPAGTGVYKSGQAVTIALTGFHKAFSSVKDIVSYKFNTPSVTGTISGKAIALTVPFGTNVTALVPTIEISPKATISPATGVAQNFTSPVKYTVTAEDGSKAEYTVTLTIGPNSSELETISSFSVFPNPSTDGQIYFNGNYNVGIYNLEGNLVKVANNTNVVSIIELPSGIYYIRNDKGETVKMIVE